MKEVPTYTADGRRFCSYSLEAIERLLRSSKIIVQRNRKGAIVVAYFRQPDGVAPVRKSPHLGTSYSFYKRVGQVQLWQHKRLHSPAELACIERSFSEEQAERSLIKAFPGVPLSVLVSNSEKNQLVRSALLPVKAKLPQTPRVLPACRRTTSSAQMNELEARFCTKELAVLLGISERAAHNLMHSGEIEPLSGRSRLRRTRKHARSSTE